MSVTLVVLCALCIWTCLLVCLYCLSVKCRVTSVWLHASNVGPPWKRRGRSQRDYQYTCKHSTHIPAEAVPMSPRHDERDSKCDESTPPVQVSYQSFRARLVLQIKPRTSSSTVDGLTKHAATNVTVRYSQIRPWRILCGELQWRGRFHPHSQPAMLLFINENCVWNVFSLCKLSSERWCRDRLCPPLTAKRWLSNPPIHFPFTTLHQTALTRQLLHSLDKTTHSSWFVLRTAIHNSVLCPVVQKLTLSCTFA